MFIMLTVKLKVFFGHSTWTHFEINCIPRLYVVRWIEKHLSLFQHNRYMKPCGSLVISKQIWSDWLLKQLCNVYFVLNVYDWLVCDSFQNFISRFISGCGRWNTPQRAAQTNGEYLLSCSCKGGTGPPHPSALPLCFGVLVTRVKRWRFVPWLHWGPTRGPPRENCECYTLLLVIYCTTSKKRKLQVISINRSSTWMISIKHDCAISTTWPRSVR